MRIKTTTLSLFWVVCFCQVFASQSDHELKQKFEAIDNFAIHLPIGWEEIPKEILEQYSKSIRQETKNFREVVYDYGYQLSSSDYWLQYPYIVVQVKRTGRIPSGEFKNMDKIEIAMEEGIDQVENSQSIMSNVQLDKPSYDSELHILWILLETKVEGIGKVKGLSGLLLTEAGAIQISCYSLSSGFDEYVPLFEKIIRNCEIDESIKYRSRMLDSIPMLNKIDFGKVIGRIIGFAIVSSIITYFIRRKRST